MDSSTRIRRVEAIPIRPSPPAGEVAMLGRPSLVSFAGACARGEEADGEPRAGDAQDDDIGQVEPDLSRPAPEELRLDEERAAPVSEEDFTAGVVASAADTMAMLAEHRVTRPMSLRPSREARILALADAIFATGERAVADVLGWWERARDDGGPWAIWPPVFLLGLLDGPDGLLAIERLVESLRPEEAGTVLVAADALAVVPHPDVVALAEDLLEADSPVARAIGLEVLSRRGGLDVERIAPHLDAEAPALLASALRALVRVESTPPSVERVLPFLRHADPDVAWEAARAVTLWGSPEALRALREGQSLGAMLGARAAELFVMAGDAGDIAHLETLTTRSPLSPELLDAIGRFGNPLAWSFLLHFLADREIGDGAEQALVTLFGALVAPEVRNPSAWRDALAERDLDPTVRYRRGEPWTPGLVVNECATAGTHSQRAIECRLDELAARTGIPMSADLAMWTSGADTRLLAVSERALRARWRAGAWSASVERRGEGDEEGRRQEAGRASTP